MKLSADYYPAGKMDQYDTMWCAISKYYDYVYTGHLVMRFLNPLGGLTNALRGVQYFSPGDHHSEVGL